MATALVSSSAPGARQWIRLETPFRESRTLIRTLAGHTGAVHCCAISPDGSFIVSGSDEGSLKIWDKASGCERATLHADAQGIWRCAISPDGHSVVARIHDDVEKIWDIDSRAEGATLPECLCWAIGPDGSIID